MPKTRVLLIGWDAADWKVIQPLLDAGQMPNLARLIEGGMHGNLATLYPPLSPMLWTSIATGKRAYKHGIHGFSEPLPDGSGVRPISLLSRKTKAVWNILNQTGHRSVVVGWWPSHPAEPLNGAMVSNFFQEPRGVPGAIPPLPRGAVHPASLAESLGDLRVNPMELSGEFIRLFVPEFEKVDQARDKRLHSLGKIIAETMSIHAVGTELLATQPWDFAAIYYSGIDHFGHGFMSYHPPRLPWVPEEDFATYQHVIANAYRYHDAMLGTLLDFADDKTTVILMSDHGFHPDHLRPGYIPAEPAGPAVEHRHFGILCLKGPDLRVNEQLYGASLLDLCPTLLALFGLPPGRDMDGKVLLTAFKQPSRVEPIDSWDSVPGDAGMHPPETSLDPVASAQAFQQLVELGYVAPPGPNVKETIDECVRELRYNLARASRDGNFCGEAAALAEGLWERWPKEHRFGILLVECLGSLGQLTRRRAVIEELGRRIERYQAEAREELARLENNRKSQSGEAPGQPSGDPQSPGSKTPRPDGEEASPGGNEFSPARDNAARARFEERQLRELSHGRPLLVEWFRVSQALLEKQPAEARKYLNLLVETGVDSGAMSQRVAGALAELGDLETARSLLEDSLESDPENALVHAQLAAIHFQAERFDEAIAAATESLSLVYFQPGLHALFGQALMERSRFEEAEKELLVAVAQSPRNLAAHELLGRLYRQHLNRPADAFAHEGRALSLRNELLARRRVQDTDTAAAVKPEGGPLSPPGTEQPAKRQELPAPFDATVDPKQTITVVSGLPRSGTSMMMQLLVAAGREPLSDAKRVPDADNPLGYFEFEKVLGLAKDATWVPQARGKVVKIVTQLLPFLPRNEHYHILLMERNVAEVIASQNAMLAQQGRPGAELGDQQLSETYAAQVRRVRQQLARRPEMRTLFVNYAELLADPAAGVDRLAQFLGQPFDREAAAHAIRPELRRQNVSPAA
jgi:predicted AlkP superfamily phosphohydrolase/phosphomutase/tetratricopeptide (TPR) repeat protein